MEKYKDYSFRELQLEVKKKGLTADGTREELIAKLEGVPMEKKESTDERINKLESMIMALLNKDKPVQEEVEEKQVVEEEPTALANTPVGEEDFDEELDVEEDKPKRVEPKVFKAGIDEKVVETKVSGGAPEDLLLNDYLVKKGITFNELNNILRTYIGKVDSSDTVRVTTIDELEQQIKIGMDKAKAIEKSGKTRVEITKDIHVVDALRKLGWASIGISGGTHTMEKLQ